jgi:hypothetical protein
VAFCFPFVLMALGTFQIVRLSRTIGRSTITSNSGLSLSWSYQRGAPVRQD